MTLLNVKSPPMLAVVMAELQRQADLFRASGLLGKPGALTRLFDFLLSRSLTGEAPKEIEIALQVFGKDANFDVAQDSVVRVYVHKLRRRLEEFATRSLTPYDSRITIPKGEYRLVLEPAAAAAPAEVAPVRQGWLQSALAMVGAFVAGIVLTYWVSANPEERELRELRHSAVWGPLLDDDLPITLVVGDYFLLGQVDEADNVQRLVREFSINSNQDLLDNLQLNPELVRNYRNLDLTYLPAATAFALQDLAPVLNAGKPVRVSLLSTLDPSALKSTHIVYIGYISAMGILGDRVFAQSRLAIGGTFDELHDNQTGTNYVSTAMPHGIEGGAFRDFGYFSTFAGPNGNRVVVISGTRDTGVMHVAEALSHRDGVEQLAMKSAGADSFESLYEIDGMARAGLNARLLFVSSMKNDAIWNGTP